MAKAGRGAAAKPGKNPRGRTSTHDTVFDQNIAASKDSGVSVAQLAKEHGKSEKWILDAIKRAKQKVRDRDRLPRRK